MSVLVTIYLQQLKLLNVHIGRKIKISITLMHLASENKHQIKLWMGHMWPIQVMLRYVQNTSWHHMQKYVESAYK